MSVIEATTFRLAEGATEAEFLVADERVQWALGSRAGLLRRTTARGDGGEWIVVTLWSSAAAADAAAAAADADADGTGATEAFWSFLDPASVRTSRYRLLG